MYYRRRIILALLEKFEGKIKKTDFQKLLMMLSKHQDKPSFDFVPYKYGCFSFQSYADMRTMIKYGQVSEVKHDDPESYWVKTEKDQYFPNLKKKDQQIIQYLTDTFSEYSTEQLIKNTYVKYPYYAINSTIVERILTVEELKEVYSFRSENNEEALYTIGYEGISQENYLNKLLKNNIKVLCDVRRNPFSMKYGFSKKQLSSACQGLGIKYIHLPELGIESNKRKGLKNQCDYDLLFEEYNKNLDNERATEGIKNLLQLLSENERVAITCFEANIHQCHRKHLANRINLLIQNFQVIHI